MASSASQSVRIARIALLETTDSKSVFLAAHWGKGCSMELFEHCVGIEVFALIKHSHRRRVCFVLCMGEGGGGGLFSPLDVVANTFLSPLP